MAHGTPGPCPICGAAHTACTSGQGPITVVQLPARDSTAARAPSDPLLGTLAAPVSEVGAGGSAPLGDGSDGQPFSTATYRGSKKRGARSRPSLSVAKE